MSDKKAAASEMPQRKKVILGVITAACLIAAAALFYLQFTGGSVSPVAPEVKEAAAKNDEIQKQMQTAQPKTAAPTPATGGDFERKTTRGSVAPK
jgi:hypothetical protein